MDAQYLGYCWRGAYNYRAYIVDYDEPADMYTISWSPVDVQPRDRAIREHMMKYTGNNLSLMKFTDDEGNSIDVCEALNHWYQENR